MARRKRRGTRALGAVKGPVSCPRPTYGRTLGGTLVGDVVNGAIMFAGVVGGAIVFGGAPPWQMPRMTPTRMREAAIGAAIGGAVGYVAGIPLAMMADRAVIRSKECPRASLGRLFGARLAKGVVISGAVYATRAITPEHARRLAPVVSVAGLFATVPLTQAIIRT